MMRLRAVRSLLVDAASLRVAEVEGGDQEAWRERAAREEEAIHKARRRALLVVWLDAVALAVLFVLRGEADAFLALGQGEEGVFTLGVLLVAVHLGFRLAQYLQLRQVDHLYRELMEREEG